MMSAQEVLFAAMFAAALIALAVYFVYLSAFVAWRRLASPFFRIAVSTSCAWFWWLCAAGFLEYCGAWARRSRHTHVWQEFHQASGVFLAVALGTFVISFAGVAIGVTESLLRGRRTI